MTLELIQMMMESLGWPSAIDQHPYSNREALYFHKRAFLEIDGSFIYVMTVDDKFETLFAYSIDFVDLSDPKIDAEFETTMVVLQIMGVLNHAKIVEIPTTNKLHRMLNHVGIREVIASDKCTNAYMVSVNRRKFGEDLDAK